MNPAKVYKKFVDDRDRALEQLFTNYRLKFNDIVQNAFGEITFAFSKGFVPDDSVLKRAALDCQRVLEEMRRSVFILAGASEAEILGRVFQKKTKFSAHDFDHTTDVAAGGSLAQRVFYNLRKIVRKLQNFKDKADLEKRSLSQEEIVSAFPKKKKIPNLILKKVRVIKESESEDYPIEMSNLQISDSEWDQVVEDYKSAYKIDSRGPEVYGWEVEQDLTHEFVQATRSGQTSAAEQNDIKDFVWIAVIDNKTCDCTGCCLPRDGLTTSEIARLLKTKWKSATILVTVPPAHLRCRCTLAPVTDNLPPVPSSLIGDFNDWLESD